MTQSGNHRITESRFVGRGFARLGLLGNPGDAVGGPAITLAISDLWAEAVAEPSDRLRLIEPEVEWPEWGSLEELFSDIRLRGYHGGRRLMMALIQRLARHSSVEGLAWPPPLFTLSWQTTIPLRVGLGGSSALLTAAMRALCDLWGLRLSPSEAVKLLLRCEVKDLGIPAGPQDRVAQVHEGLCYLEIDDSERLRVERLDTEALPPLFVAVDDSAGEGTEVFHSSLQERHAAGDTDVQLGVRRLAELARRGRDLLREGRGHGLGPLMDENFDIRRGLLSLNPRHEEMVMIARGAGAHAKFAGSGGAIVGTCPEGKMQSVLDALRARQMSAFRPTIAHPWTEAPDTR
jgi:glucuronokinase